MTIIDVAERRRIGGDDMDIDAQPVGMQPDRMVDPLHAIDGVKCRMGMEDDLAVAVDRAPAHGKQLLNVRLFDLVAAQFDLDIGDVADQAPGSEACPNIIDRDAGNSLCNLDRLAHGNLAGFHIGHIAALDAPALPLAGAEHAQSPVRVARHDQRADL